MKMPVEKIYDDRSGVTRLRGTDEDNTFVMYRDQHRDVIVDMEDGADRIKLFSFDVGFDSVRLQRVDLLTYKVFVRDEVLNVSFRQPAPEDIPASGWLLDESDFIFRKGLPPAPVQVQLEQSSTEKETVRGTNLPDVFVFTYDGYGEVIKKFEPGKDQIDLSGYATSFDDLDIVDRFPGRITVRIETDMRTEWFQVNDPSNLLTSETITADDFIF